jgi:hypothetical protein
MLDIISFKQACFDVDDTELSLNQAAIDLIVAANPQKKHPGNLHK